MFFELFLLNNRDGSGQRLYQRTAIPVLESGLFQNLRIMLLDFEERKFRDEEPEIGVDKQGPCAGIPDYRRDQDIGVNYEAQAYVSP